MFYEVPEMTIPPMPGGPVENKPLHFIWICDCSGSMMADGKISSLNDAIKQSLPEMKKIADQNPFAKIFVRAIKFSNGAEWINNDPVPLENFSWFDLEADGVTDMGKALSMVADEMKIPPMPKTRAFPPVLVLVSDGQPTDNYEGGLKKLLGEPWGKRAVRIGIGIGNDADMDVLQKFINNPEIKPLLAHNSPELIKLIRWVSTTVTQTVSESSESHGGFTPPPLPNGDEKDPKIW